jgi:hypothetical protein
MRRDDYRHENSRLEIAKILAAGIIRLKLRQMSNTDGDSVGIAEYSSSSRLDVSSNTVLSVSPRVNRCLISRNRR